MVKKKSLEQMNYWTEKNKFIPVVTGLQERVGR